MKTCLCLSIVASLGLGLAACGKKAAPPTATTNAPAAAGNPLTAPADYLGAMGRAKRLAEKTVDMNAINQAIQLFYAQEDRFPKDLNELVAQHYLPQLPEPPAGMRFAYQPATGQISLVRATPAPTR